MVPIALTLLFSYLKLNNVIDWSWLTVLAPTIFIIVINVLLFLVGVIKAIYIIYLAKKEKDDG